MTSQFESFKKEFSSHYSAIWDFMDEMETHSEERAMAYKLEANEDEIEHDSYGDENSTLSRVFYFPEFSIFVRFIGFRQSYSGTEWTGMEQVQPKTKNIQIYEPVKQ